MAVDSRYQWVDARRRELRTAVRKAVSAQEMPLTALAELLGIPPKNLYRILYGGNRIPEDFEQRVAEALSITVKQLMRSK